MPSTPATYEEKKTTGRGKTSATASAGAAAGSPSTAPKTDGREAELLRRERALQEREDMVVAQEQLLNAEREAAAAEQEAMRKMQEDLTTPVGSATGGAKRKLMNYTIPKKPRPFVEAIEETRTKPWYIMNSSEAERDYSAGGRLVDGFSSLRSYADQQVVTTLRNLISIRFRLIKAGSELNTGELSEDNVRETIQSLDVANREIIDSIHSILFQLEGKCVNNSGRQVYSADLSSAELNRARQSRYRREEGPGGDWRRGGPGGMMLTATTGPSGAAGASVQPGEQQQQQQPIPPQPPQPRQPVARQPSGPCYRCGGWDHWIKMCPY